MRHTYIASHLPESTLHIFVGRLAIVQKSDSVNFRQAHP